jgi:hypothetical protein
MNATQDWIEAYKELCAIIKTNINEIDHIDMFYDQIFSPQSEDPFPPNCVFIEFNTESIKTIGLKAQDLEMAITFYHCFETLSETYHTSDNQAIALAFGAIQRKLHNKLQALTGVNFSSLNRIGLKRIPTPNTSLIVYALTYTSIIRDYAAIDEFTDVTIGEVTIEEGTAPALTDLGMFNVGM